ncbi:pentapeptide repeat-containing protein [Nocardia sp. NPDC052566]|uniref:pentapeptide repeat-containing protein n=1 Tax=Nocardia sp. NPDC052566 TaxID=3364330 RepID=UPI0037C652D6
MPIAGAVVTVAAWILFSTFHPKTGETSVEAARLAFTVAGGVGGVVALVVVYRRQRNLEQGRFVERFAAAAAQIGAADAAVRIAGVYAMAGLADVSSAPRRQQSIDILCGYLRRPHGPDHGDNGRTSLVITTPRGNGYEDIGKAEEQFDNRQSDREVRATITSVIAAHVRPEAEHSWSRNTFDLRDAHLVDVNFNGAKFLGHAGFAGAKFSGEAEFEDATFFCHTEFDGATFCCDARFAGAIFVGRVGFEDATFTGDARFTRAMFVDKALFDGVKFCGEARFEDTTFADDVTFRDAAFAEDGWFPFATFSGDASFERAAFAGGTFAGADFGTGAVTFAEPLRWDRAPVFDWDADLSIKPGNVEPTDWPPNQASPELRRGHNRDHAASQADGAAGKPPPRRLSHQHLWPRR